MAINAIGFWLVESLILERGFVAWCFLLHQVSPMVEQVSRQQESGQWEDQQADVDLIGGKKKCVTR